MKTFLCILAVIVALGWLFGLMGCAALEDMPVTIGVEGRHGVYGYSSADGLSIRAKVRQEKSGRISPKEISNRWKP